MLCLNTIYFFVYFSLLDLSFSWLQLFFIAIVTLSYCLLLSFLRYKLWHLLCYLVMMVVYVSSLVNFAYYSVYRVFIDFSFNQAGQMNPMMFNHLKDFYYEVPGRLYLLAIVIFVGILINSILFYSLTAKKSEKFLFNFSIKNLISKNKPRSKKYVMGLVIVFCLVNLIAFGASSYLYNNPRDTWSNLKGQVADLGFFGHFYSQVYASTRDDLVGSDQGTAYLEQTKELYSRLDILNERETVSTIALPEFSEKPNVLIVQMESAGSWIIENSQSPMPYLQKLIKENVSVPNFQPNSCQTINAEFSSLCSFWPNSYEPVSYSHQQNQYYCLPSILKNRYDYSTYLFHSDYPEFWNRDVLSPKWGFDNTYFVPHYKVKEDDASVYKDAVKTLAKESEPFFAEIITFTGHGPHNDNYVTYNDWSNNLKIKDFTGKIDKRILSNSALSEKEIRRVFGFFVEVDNALKVLFEELEDKKLLDNTVVLIYNDHRYYDFSDKDPLLKFDLYNRSPFLIITPDKQKGVVQQIASHVDVAPTILNLIEQDDYQPVEHFVGTSLFSENHPNTVLNKCLGQIYFMNEDIIIEGNAKSGMYSVLDSKDSLTQIKKDHWLDLVGDLVAVSDKTIYEDGLLGE